MYEIKLKIHDESDLYSRYDPEQILLSDEIISYILRKYEERPDVSGKHVIHIYSDIPVDEKRIQNNFLKYTKEEEKITLRQQNQSRIKQMRLFLIGIVFIGLWLFVANVTDSIMSEVLSIFGSFAIWEAANIWIVEAPEQKFYQRRLAHLEMTEIIFTIEEKDNATAV